MSTLQDIISDEIVRLKSLVTLYENKLKTLPKGYLSVKKINDHVYYYVAYRDGDTVKTDYLGKDGSPEVVEQISIHEEKKKIKKLLKETKKNLSEAEKAFARVG